MNDKKHRVLKLAIDVDGVILDIMNPFCHYLNKKFNTNYSIHDITEWDSFLNWNIPEKEIMAIFDLILNNKIMANLIDEDIPRIMKLLNQIWHVDIVTAREKENREKLVEILNHNGMVKNIHYHELIMVEKTPPDAKLKHEHDIYIDDNPYLIDSMPNYPEKCLLLFNQPWNQTNIHAKNIIRIFSWKEVIKIISRYSQEREYDSN
ncbi:MAG: 5' nucleotidase, NT5C type [Promethearchaeota archaeon]